MRRNKAGIHDCFTGGQQGKPGETIQQREIPRGKMILGLIIGHCSANMDAEPVVVGWQAGERLMPYGHASGHPKIEWRCGPVPRWRPAR